MEKDFMQLNDDQLKEVSGGEFNPDEFMKINDKEKAIEYLIQNGAKPGQGFYESYLAVWMKIKM